MKIDERIENYLNEEEEFDEGEEDLFDNDSDLMQRMFDVIVSLNSDDLTESQAEEVTAIIDEIAGDIRDDAEETSEAIAAKRVKIRPSERRARRKQYRKNRAKLKLKAKRFRRTGKFKRWQRLKKRKAKSGKTATGKRIRKFIGGRK